MSRYRTAAESEQPFHFVFLEEELDSLGVLIDHLLLAILPGLEVELHAADVDAELFGSMDLFEHVGILQKRFGWNAAAVGARAAHEGILLDDRHLHAELAGADAGDVSARTAADDENVVLWIGHGAALYESTAANLAAGAPATCRRYCAGT